MMDQLLRKGPEWRRVAQGAAALLTVASVGLVGGCLNRPIGRNEPKTTSTIVEPFTQSAVDKIDLLLMIDNSRSMADKQAILADAVPDLVKGLVNPKCVDPNDFSRVAPTQPTDPLKDCETGFKREFEPVVNIHIGIISSSLGAHGADACPAKETVCPNGQNPSNNDAGHLLTRKDACSPDKLITYQDKGFLAWDPKQQLMPPGEKNIGDPSMPGSGIVPTLKDMVIGIGQIGCGYEAQHESWYRFLIDPEPYKDVTIQDGKAVPTGTDSAIIGDPTQMILGQRADFLRPSSLLAIIMLTDENDCSIKESGTSYLAAQQRDLTDSSLEYHLPRARAVCATNPNDPCCKSCGSAKGDCAEDPTCGPPVPPLSGLEDDVNLRCFDQKRRFGFDFLYPIDRYTNGLTQPKVPKRDGTLVANPIFSDLNPNDNDSNIRNRGLVFIAGIVGVPWQLIARKDKDGNPNLVTGLDFEKNAIGGFKTFEELSAKETDGSSTWEKILGDPATYVPPKDPHMVETPDVRAGLSVTMTDPYNGHEYTIAEKDDLQYACIFDLPAKRDCSKNTLACDCDTKAAPDNPLCDATVKTDQIKAKSYPGLRELALLKSVGPQGIVASVCPAQLNKPDQPDYGYRPAIGAIINRLKSELSGQCLPRQLTPVVTELDDGSLVSQVPCLILEARNTGGQCSCDTSKARNDVTDAHKAAVKAAQANSIAQGTNWDCFCEIAQTGDPANIKAGLSSREELTACQEDVIAAPLVAGGPQDKQPANGWCYVDATTTPPTGNQELVKNCQANEKRKVRFVGAGNPLPNATLFITCSGGSGDM